MSDSSPLIPRGSLLEQQAKGRPHLRIALCIVAGHLVFLGGLLMQGCKRDDPADLASGTGLPTLELTNIVAPTPLEVRPPMPIPLPPSPLRTEPEPGPIPVPLAPPEPLEMVPDWQVEAPPPVREPAVPPRAPAAVREHTVAAGDTFYGLAQRYGLSAGDIARANPQVDAARLRIGQRLVIPAPSATPERPAAADVGEGVYVVKRGDTLTRIAREHGTTVEALKQLNNLTTDRIIIDQRLRVPTVAPRPGPGGN